MSSCSTSLCCCCCCCCCCCKQKAAEYETTLANINELEEALALAQDQVDASHRWDALQVINDTIGSTTHLRLAVSHFSVLFLMLATCCVLGWRSCWRCVRRCPHNAQALKNLLLT